jgi:D-alanyl-D-alanine dipeptidase
MCMLLTSEGYSPARADQPLPYAIEDVVALSPPAGTIRVHLAYSTSDNFLHEDVYGDLEACYLRREVAEMLAAAQMLLEEKRMGYQVIVYDCLRPRSVQYTMWRLVKGTGKEEYVADPEKGSIHNFGAAVDVSIVDQEGNRLDMGTPFDYFGDLAQPRYEDRFLREGALTENQVENRRLLREVMEKAGFQTIPDEWWHFNAFSPEEVKRRYAIVEFFLSREETEDVLQRARDLPRDENGFCLLVGASEKKMYLIKHSAIQLVFDVALGKGGLGKTREGDHKTPLGDYKIKWMVSRNGPPKQNPGGLTSSVIEGKTYAVLDTELYVGDLTNIRVKVLPDGTRKVSEDSHDRPITREEIEIAQGEKLWTDAYGGQQVYVMALDYPNKEDRAQGKTGSCIEIHASVNLEKVGYEDYKGTLGCVSLYPAYAKRMYDHVNPGTPVRIIE